MTEKEANSQEEQDDNLNIFGDLDEVLKAAVEEESDKEDSEEETEED